MKPSPKTATWGYYDAKTPPALRIKSGDTVEIQTLITASRERYESAGLWPDRVEPAWREIYDQVKDHGPGIHMLTGPIYVEGAEPGDVLEVRIQKIRLAIPYALNAFSPGRGFLPEDFPYERVKVIPLDEKRMVAQFGDGIEIPLRPFFGSMGVAPPASSGRISSAPPWVNAGNLDNKELVAGTTLFIPIHAPGALFQAGDGHAGQGDGEVDITAMETSLVGTFQFFVRKDMRLRWPRAETPTEFITMGSGRRSHRSDQDGGPRNDRFPDAGKTHDARRRLHAGQRRRRPSHHPSRRRQQRRPHDDFESDFYESKIEELLFSELWL